MKGNDLRNNFLWMVSAAALFAVGALLMCGGCTSLDCPKAVKFNEEMMRCQDLEDGKIVSTECCNTWGK